MLSRLALRQVIGGGSINSSKLCAVQCVRNSSVDAQGFPVGLQPEFDPRIRAKALGAKPEFDPNKRPIIANEFEIAPSRPLSVPIETQVANIKRAHETFYGPQRDMKNFPHPVMAENYEPTNFIFIPTRKLKLLYERIGVSGCYTLFLGTTAFLLSKEIFPVDHALPEVLLIGTAGTIMYKKLAPKAEAAIEKLSEARRAEQYTNKIEEANAMLDEDIDVYQKEIWRLNAIQPIFQAKKEQIDLQLEVEYRSRLAQIHKAVKDRLDYQADRDFLERKFEQEHMVNWIVDNVKKSITPQQEKENIASCIQTLKQLSATA